MEPNHQSCSTLVHHGRMSCDRCWKNVPKDEKEAGPFQLVRDPGHWGSSNPATMILGISKGNTQSKGFASGHFDSVAFAGIRQRLLQVLQTVGLLEGESISRFEHRFRGDEQEYAFASVVRCSLTGMDRKKGVHTADSPNVVPALRAGSAGYDFAFACVDQHLRSLPPATQRVILLSNTDAYINHLRALIGLSRGGLRRINDVAYHASGVLFVHVSHPSRGNGHFGKFNRGEGTPGAKMRLARDVLAPDYTR